MTTSQNIEVVDAKGIPHLYRPQRSCGKVMFSQASVILFTGGGGVYAQHALGQTPPLPGRHPPGRHPLGRHCPGQTPPLGRHVPQGRHPPANIPHPTATAAKGTHPTGMHSCISLKKVRLVDSVRNLCTPQCYLFLHILEC